MTQPLESYEPMADAADEPVVEFRDLWKSYGSKQILSEANLRIRRGEVLVILGGSGSGKSVSLRHMLGLEHPDEGQVLVEGENITELQEQDLYPIRKKFGMLFQSAALFDSMTVFGNVSFPLREHTAMPEEEMRRVVAETLELVDLEGTEEVMPVDLSGGMRKRVGLARAIVLRPHIILYDEPTTGLDPITADTINQLIVHLQSKLQVTSVVVTHDIQSAFTVGDRIAFLSNGHFEWLGTMEEARRSDHPMLREFLTKSNIAAARPVAIS
ncbi:MAG TPA: ABC transporter ATP-binding protein [Thermoanaerobaculia bacterium]|nr:ABC transporter ATP-binding protein [Thermoanaerobaculia bacterium]